MRKSGRGGRKQFWGDYLPVSKTEVHLKQQQKQPVFHGKNGGLRIPRCTGYPWGHTQTGVSGQSPDIRQNAP